MSQTDLMIDSIRRAMAEDGRTQGAFAADLGISEKHLSLIYNGRANPSFGLLDRMLDFLALDLRVERRDG